MAFFTVWTIIGLALLAGVAAYLIYSGVQAQRANADAKVDALYGKHAPLEPSSN